MNRLLRRIDQDVVALLNSGRRTAHTGDASKKYSDTLLSVYAPRLTWVKLIAPLLVLLIPIMFLHGPIQTYWMLVSSAAIVAFFGL